jgi:transposase
LVRQSVSQSGDLAWIEVEPDKRFHVVCHVCGQPAGAIHQWQCRPLRDLNLGSAAVWINCRYRTVFCPTCGGYRVEDLGFFVPRQRGTKRLARAIHDLCKVLPVKAVADHYGLDWKTVKQIDKTFLEAEHGETDYAGLRILAVDEIAIRKGHRYLTVVIDHETGRVVWLGQDRKAETLKAFFDGMTEAQKAGIEAIAMDMLQPYITAVEAAVPQAKIIFDLFHVVHGFNTVIDQVRISEYRAASAADREVYRGAKYLLVANRQRITKPKARAHLNRLLALNENLSKVMVLKDMLKRIWRYRSRGWADRRLTEWCDLARSIDHPAVHRFARRLERHREGILNHCDYPIHTGRIEGINNKIKVIKRSAYGFHDDRYFTLKVIQAFSHK